MGTTQDISALVVELDSGTIACVVCEAAVDELAKFVLDPSSYKSVMESLQTVADNYWANN